MREVGRQRPRGGGRRSVVADGGDRARGQDDDHRHEDHEPEGLLLALPLMLHLAAPWVIRALLRREPSAITVMAKTSRPVARRGTKAAP